MLASGAPVGGFRFLADRGFHGRLLRLQRQMADHVEQYIFVCGARIVHLFLGTAGAIRLNLRKLSNSFGLAIEAGTSGGPEAEKGKSA